MYTFSCAYRIHIHMQCTHTHTRSYTVDYFAIIVHADKYIQKNRVRIDLLLSQNTWSLFKVAYRAPIFVIIEIEKGVCILNKHEG